MRVSNYIKVIFTSIRMEVLVVVSGIVHCNGLPTAPLNEGTSRPLFLVLPWRFDPLVSETMFSAGLHAI